jgi:hypothetical protein
VRFDIDRLAEELRDTAEIVVRAGYVLVHARQHIFVGG